jgi:hypothetical protein
MRGRIPSTPITRPAVPSSIELKAKYENKLQDAKHHIESEYFNPFDVREDLPPKKKKAKGKKKKGMYDF